jgi:hypothetical protein
MKIKTGVNFHNRFDIVKNGEWVGYAENIILNQMYNRICNFSTYFANIHFGTGSGTPTPDRTSLFSHLGTKTAEVEEKIKAYPTSRVTKKITLMPEEYVGQTITEVGVAYGSSASDLVTHAMIKDSEGNPLSITKTELDVITIYATVFVELQDTNNITFSRYPNNQLVNYFIDDSSMGTSLWLGDNEEPTEMGTIGYRIGEFYLTRSVDVANKKTLFSTRLGIDDANYDIREMSLGDICRVSLENSLIWQPYALTDVAIGVGDGESDTFDLGRYDMSNVVIRVDGNVTNEYVLQNISGNYRRVFPFYKLVSPTANVDREIYRGACAGVQETVRKDVTQEWTIEVDENDIIGEKVEIRTKYSGGGAGSYVYVYGSYDGESFTQIYYSQHGGTITHSAKIENPYKYIRVAIRSGGTVYVDYIGWVNKNYKRPQIVFNTPPPEGSVITADYTVPYIPKTEEYVLDVEFTLQFGEGV